MLEKQKNLQDNKNNPILLLINSLKMLNLIPKSGNGRVELIFQDGILLDTVLSNRVRLKEKID